MLMLLLAAGVMAAAPPYSYDVDLELLSPLIQYSSRPFILDPVNVTYPSLVSNASDVPPGWRDRPKIQPLNDSQLQPYLDMGWTAVMYAPGTLSNNRQPKDAMVTQAAGDGFTLSVPSGIDVRVTGETQNAEVEVTLDGFRLGGRDVQAYRNTAGTWLWLDRIPGGPGPHNLTVRLRSGRMNITNIRTRPSIGEFNALSTWL